MAMNPADWPILYQFLIGLSATAVTVIGGWFGVDTVRNRNGNGTGNGNTKKWVELTQESIKIQAEQSVSLRKMAKGIGYLVEAETRRQIREEERHKLEMELPRDDSHN